MVRKRFSMWEVLILLAFSVAVLLGGFGCSGKYAELISDPCDDAPETSYLCQIAKEYEVNLDIVADGIGMAVAGGVALKAYSADDVINVYTELITFMEGSVTYLAFKTKLGDMELIYPGMLQLADKYTAALASELLIDDWDKAYIVARLKAKVEIYKTYRDSKEVVSSAEIVRFKVS